MEEDKKNNEIIEENSKIDNNPLSVRIDSQFKELFNGIINEKGMSKKLLLEKMISFYIENESKTNHINYLNDYNLLSINLEEILKHFKSIVTKSEESIELINNDATKVIKEKDNEIQSLKLSLESLTKQNKELIQKNQETSNGIILLESKYGTIESKHLKKESEFLDLRNRNLELLENLNSIRKAEVENVLLKEDVEKLTKENRKCQNEKEDLNLDISRLEKKIEQIKMQNKENEEKKNIEYNTKESLIRKELELNNKIEILELHNKLNELQKENIMNISIINNLNIELREGRIQVENLVKELEKFKSKEKKD